METTNLSAKVTEQLKLSGQRQALLMKYWQIKRNNPNDHSGATTTDVVRQIIAVENRLMQLLGEQTYLATPMYSLSGKDQAAAKLIVQLRSVIYPPEYWELENRSAEIQKLVDRHNLRPCILLSSPSAVICVRGVDYLTTHNSLYDRVVTKAPDLQCVACSGYYFEAEGESYLALDSTIGLVATSLPDKNQQIISIPVYNEDTEHVGFARPVCADPTSGDYKQLRAVPLGKFAETERATVNKLR